jgi:hypothetical protein
MKPNRKKPAPILPLAAALLLSLLSPLIPPAFARDEPGARKTPAAATATYRNPLLGDVADPFVLKWRGEYYLYRTSTGKGLDVHTSRDLVHWKPGPTVWEPDVPDQQHPGLVWAPEVYYDNGTFYLLFCDDTPKEQGQRLWVATATSPLGPFRTLPGGPFSPAFRIDGHIFTDDDGKRYLYSCHSPAGGGARVEGRALAGFDDRADAGWQTVIPADVPWEGGWTEAPTVWRDPDSPTPLYYMMYSGGGAMLPRYHTGYATATNPLGPWTKRGILIDTMPGVAGPGHQALALAPDNVTPYLVYHAKRLVEEGWARDLFIDRMAYASGHTLATHGPTTAPQPLPPLPRFRDFFDADASRGSYAFEGGRWRVDTAAREMIQESAGGGTARLKSVTLPENGIVEVNVRSLRPEGNGTMGLRLLIGDRGLRVTLPAVKGGRADVGGNVVTVPAGFDPAAYHQLLVTRRGRDIRVRLDGLPLGSATLTEPDARAPAAIALITTACQAAFSGIAVTTYADPLPLPDVPVRDPLNGWRVRGDGTIEQRLLGAVQQVYPVAKPLSADAGSFSAEVQGWALGRAVGFPKYGLRIRGATDADYVEAWIDPATSVLATHGRIGGVEIPWQNSALPLGFDFTDFHKITVSWSGTTWRFVVDEKDAVQIRTIKMPDGRLRPALVTEDSRAIYRNVKASP